MSNDGRFPGSSFIQILINLARCGEIPGGMLTRSSSNAICNKYCIDHWFALIIKNLCACACARAYRSTQFTFIPHSMGERSAKGTSLVASSHKRTAKLHMSLASKLISEDLLLRASGDIHAGSYMRPTSWKENFESAIFTRAVRSSSI